MRPGTPTPRNDASRVLSTERTPVSTYRAYAAIAAVGFLAGRLSTQPQLRRLRCLLRQAIDRAGHDSLTGLPNRRLLEQLFTQFEQHARPILVALVDLDRFKSVNDTHGHPAGDQLLHVTAQRIHTIARARGGAAARLGGDEFLVLLPVIGGDTESGVDAVLHAITRPVTVATEHGDRLLSIQASAGSTVYHGTGPITAQLYQADIALYRAKQDRGGHCRYRPDMHMPVPTPPSGVRLRDRHAAAAE